MAESKINKMRTLTKPFKIKMVESLKVTTEECLEKVLEKVGYNTFLLSSKDVFINFLTDSGKRAMSDRQPSGAMMGGESYAGARSWERLEAVVQDLTDGHAVYVDVKKLYNHIPVYKYLEHAVAVDTRIRIEKLKES